jgi:arylamine N-acetyltransferase
VIDEGGERYRLDRDGEEIALRSILPDGERDLYAFGLEAQHHVDFEMASWFTSTHPTSRFVLHKVAARVTDGARATLVDRELRLITSRPDGSEAVETREVETGAPYLAVLREHFGIELPDDPPLRWSPRPGS